MKLEIIIECCDDDEMLRHLSDIRNKVKKALIATQNDDDFYIALKHNNCDGSYEGNIQEGKPILPLKKRIKNIKL